MKLTELDLIDAAIAGLEGPQVAVVAARGRAMRPDGTPYQPTRERDEAARLLEKYVSRLIRLADTWAAVGHDGRAHIGSTVQVAVCKAVVAHAALKDKHAAFST